MRQWLSAAESGLRRSAQCDAAKLTPEDLREMTLQLERLRRFADAAESHLLAELDELRITDIRSGLTTSKWLAKNAGLPSGVARQRLVLANGLPSLPEVDEALTAGRIGVDHARVFTDVTNERNHDALASVLDDLIDASAGTVFHKWRADVTALAAFLDPDGSHDPDGDLARNSLTLSPSNDFLLGRFELTGERALTVHDVLNAVADELFHQYTRDQDLAPEIGVPNRSALMAEALEEVCRRALGVDRATSKPPRVEAFITLRRTGGTLAERATWSIHDSMGSPIPAATLPTFLCDPVFHAALLDSLGLPVDMGRAVRRPTPAQRRALRERDGGCVFPGCDCPASWTDAHHIRQWTRDEGRSDLDNMVLVCRRHHRVAHRRGWTVTLGTDGWTRWTTPTGDTFWGQRHHRQRAGP